MSMIPLSVDSPQHSPRDNLNVSSASQVHTPRQEILDRWNTYSHTLLEKGVVTNFGIFATKNFKRWTSTPDFNVSPIELESILKGFLDDTRIRQEGIWVNEMPFTLTRMGWNNVVMVGRASNSGAGCVIFLCKSCVLVATHEEGPQTSLCFGAIEKLGDYLTAHGF